MRKHKPFILLHLATNDLPVIVSIDNIAFAMQMEGENDKYEKYTFTRVFLKSIMIDDESKWVDVKETAGDIYAQ